LNEQIKEMDNSQKLLHLSKLIIVNQQSRAETLVIVLPHRKFVHEGILGICNDKDPSKLPQERYFFLFSDMLLCCAHIQNNQLGFMKNQAKKKKKKGKSKPSQTVDDDEELEKVQPQYFVHTPIHFLGAKRDTDEIISLPFVRSFDAGFTPRFCRNNIFQLVTMKETYTFQCKTNEERVKWMELCQKVIDELIRIYNKQDKEKAIPKCYPAILRQEAALVVQKIYRGNLARKEHDKEFKNVKKTPRDFKASIPINKPSPRGEQTTATNDIPPVSDELRRKRINDEKREIEKQRHEETERYKKQLQEEAKIKAQAEKEERERKKLEEEKARKLHEEEDQRKRLAEEAEVLRKREEGRRLAEEDRRKHEEMEEIESLREATRMEEERIKKELEHLRQMHELEQQQRAIQDEEEKRKKKEVMTKMSPRPQPQNDIDEGNLSPWQREIMNRYKSKSKQNFVVVKEIETMPLKKTTSVHKEELERLVSVDIGARKQSVSHLLQKFEQLDSAASLGSRLSLKKQLS
jgi:hypothetical protein